jgi:hypothetical protein
VAGSGGFNPKAADNAKTLRGKGAARCSCVNWMRPLRCCASIQRGRRCMRPIPEDAHPVVSLWGFLPSTAGAHGGRSDHGSQTGSTGDLAEGGWGARRLITALEPAPVGSLRPPRCHINLDVGQCVSPARSSAGNPPGGAGETHCPTLTPARFRGARRGRGSGRSLPSRPQ